MNLIKYKLLRIIPVLSPFVDFEKHLSVFKN